MIERALKAAHDRWPDAKVEVERQFAADLPEVITGWRPDGASVYQSGPQRLRGHGPRRGQLRVAAAPSSDDKRGVEITFQDRGPGIPAELREQIFNPFFTTKETGVGLGLSIVSKIIDDHRGWIRVTSEPGKGACFQVYLPAGGSADSKCGRRESSEHRPWTRL